MNKNDGRFKKGERRGRATEFKKGEHWRPRKPYWDKEWLENEYVNKQRSMAEIAAEFGITENAIYFWARKLGIQTRSMKEIRAIKHWGLSGEANGMYGKRGEDTPNWKGGVTPERQDFYNSEEWKTATRAVWARDKGECKRCGKKQKGTKTILDIHHIVSFANEKHRADIDNLVLLCKKCHHWTHSKKNTERIFIKCL